MSERRLVGPEEVSSRPTRWLWEDRIPLAAVTMLDGDPDHGKSTVTYDLAARVTRGSPMPEATEPISPGGVVLLQAEDSVAEIVLPRLQTAGADVNRIRLFDRRRFVEAPLALPDDLDLIDAAVQAVGARLVVVDPLSAFLAGNMNGDASVRRAFAAMAELAERRDLAVLVVRHLRKSGAKNPLYAGTGSISAIGAVRSGLMAGRDPSSDDKHRHILAQTKGNMADAKSLSYRTVKRADGAIAIEWLGASEYTAADLSNPSTAYDEHSSVKDAQYVLYSLLAKGPLPANEVLRLARQAGVAERTLKRAKKTLGVTSRRKGSGRNSRWFWLLPHDDGRFRTFKDKELDDLMDQLLYGDGALPSVNGNQEETDSGRSGHCPNDDEGEEECGIG